MVAPVPCSAMRELQFTQTMLNKSLSQVTDRKRIKNVHLILGEISELDRNLIEHYWRELSQGTLAEHAELHFRFKEAEVQCMACFNKYHPLHAEIHCPYCGSYGANILSGEEFEIESIELDSP
jgi:hydrogenase nickel incorporation protein HypA/HybF